VKLANPASLAIGQASSGDQFPGVLPERSVGLFEERGHLSGSPLLILKDHRHRADDLLILLLKLGQLGLSRDVRLAIKRPAVLPRAVEDVIARFREPRAMRRVEIAVPEVVQDRLELRLDIANERQVSRFAIRVIGLAGHGDVPPDAFFGDRAVQLAQVEQPAFEPFRRVNRASEKLLVPRLDLVPGLEFRLIRQPSMSEVLGNVSSRGHGMVVLVNRAKGDGPSITLRHPNRSTAPLASRIARRGVSGFVSSFQEWVRSGISPGARQLVRALSQRRGVDSVCLRVGD
jgi:hypothetical protein